MYHFNRQTTPYFFPASAANLTLTAFACPSSPSRSASVTTVGPNLANPSLVNSCAVMCFWKLNVFTPLNCLAKPFVGKVWLVPLA
jgi:hypothetical protein